LISTNYFNLVCRDNEVLTLEDLIPEIEAGLFNLSFPITFHPYTFRQYNLPLYFGGLEVNDLGTVAGAEAVALNYFLDISEEWLMPVGDEWEKAFLRAMEAVAEETPSLHISRFVSGTPALEMEKSKNSITPNLLANVVIMIIFCLGASSMSDAVRSKPLIGFLGLLSACMATLAAFGFVCYTGCDFIALCLAAPFLLLGIGIDDTFVMLSSWHRSRVNGDSIPERLGRTFSDAAVSITVTSLTDFLSFFAGVITPFPCVRIFCIYTGAAVGFIYIWHLTFFGACLALAGHAERRNLHGLCCFPVMPKSLATHRNALYRAFCTGGRNPADPYNPRDNKDHAGMVFLRDVLGRALSRRWVKALVLTTFAAYLVASIWGITNIQEGLEKRNMVNYDSYSIDYYDVDDKYYKEFRFPINVVVSGSGLRYSNPLTQARIEAVMRRLENSSFVTAEMTTSWLRNFLDFIERNRGYEDLDLAVNTEAEFVHTLRTAYLNDLSTPLHLDVHFSADGRHIEASRFLLQGYRIKDALDETAMVRELRTICDEVSTEDFKVSLQ
jgi:hypothetical protein